MKHDEFAFFNQQLAAMLRDGIPSKAHCSGCARKCGAALYAMNCRRWKPSSPKARPSPTRWRAPVAGALQAHDLGRRQKRGPARRVDNAGGYFQRQNDVWTRLKSMMTYPLIVMFAAFLISMAIALLWTCAIGPIF